MEKILYKVSAWIMGACCLSCQGSKADFRSIDAAAFAEVIADSTVVLLDVRTAEEHAAGCIEGTDLHIDVLQDDFENLAEEKIEQGSTVALYCRSGNRSKRAASILASKGYKVTELATGYNGWTEYQDKYRQ